MDLKQYKTVEEIARDIKSIRIQGATNVALATLEGMRIEFEQAGKIKNVLRIGTLLANTRTNEPMARNSVKYIKFATNKGVLIDDAIADYERLIKDAKSDIRKMGASILNKYKVILTHCHSSTSTGIIIDAFKNNPDLKVVSTETRPKYQGRITSEELFEAGVDVTMIVDSASASFIVDDRYLPVEAIIIGADELLKNGSVINKVGSYQMALASEDGKDEFYVATSLLKLDPDRDIVFPEIEIRDAEEVWGEAPRGMKIINPSFEVVPGKLITGLITELGLIKPGEVLSSAKKLYSWL